MSDTTTLRKWFSHFTHTTGETPTHIVLAVMASDETKYSTHEEQDPEWGTYLANEPIAWADVDPATLDHPFDTGYGGNQSPNLCAWSENWVCFSDDYDGSEDIQWVPRHPTAHTPIRPGGG